MCTPQIFVSKRSLCFTLSLLSLWFQVCSASLCFCLCMLPCLCVYFLLSFFTAPANPRWAFALVPRAPPCLSSPTQLPGAPDKGLSRPSPGGGRCVLKEGPRGDGEAGQWA